MSSELRSENGYVPRLLTVQDISCLGKCSLTVALPVVSALGVEAAVLPTALLSTHTMLPGFSFLDLTDQMEKIIRHWEKEEITFDTIYEGYLGSVRQMEIVRCCPSISSYRSSPVFAQYITLIGKPLRTE